MVYSNLFFMNMACWFPRSTSQRINASGPPSVANIYGAKLDFFHLISIAAIICSSLLRSPWPFPVGASSLKSCAAGCA